MCVCVERERERKKERKCVSDERERVCVCRVRGEVARVREGVRDGECGRTCDDAEHEEPGLCGGRKDGWRK